MTMTWLPGAAVHDLHPAIGNGPFGTHGPFLGVILHVNVDETGTPDSFWGPGNPGDVCPNFQVYKDGSIHQMLPLDWQPWCQIDGNFQYAAIETAGLPNEPLTDAQLHACAKIVRAYHEQMGMELRIADTPGAKGLGTHEMGGAAWGGHPCPGAIRSGQRRLILALAMPTTTTTGSYLMDMTQQQFDAAVDARVSEALRAYSTGTDEGDWTAAKHPELVKGPKHGVYDRLAALETKEGVKP